MMINSFYGGVGVGYLNFYIFIIIAVFIGGLMVGRTPEFLGKKIEAKEMKIASIIALLHPLLILAGTALSSYIYAHHPEAYAGWLNNPGNHGFSEMLYEFTSSSANNGSGFEGLGDNTPFWNIACGTVMLIARFLPIIGPVAIAGILAKKKYIPESAGTLKTDTGTFGIMVFAGNFYCSCIEFLPRIGIGANCRVFWNKIILKNQIRIMSIHRRKQRLFEPALVSEALKQSFVKLNPRIHVSQPGNVYSVRSER